MNAFTKLIVAAAFAAGLAATHVPAVAADPAPAPQVAANGIVKVKSGYPFDETITRLKADIAAKGIMFFMAVEQSKLAEQAGVKLSPSTLLIFGNPPLGVQFLTANPDAGLDWPVRLLVNQDDKGQVWMTYTDFFHIARRHDITTRDAAFAMATKVIGSITSAATR